MLSQTSQTESSNRKKMQPVNKKTRRPAECCDSAATTHPDHAYALPRIRRIQGQLTGVEKMIQARRYCPDILIQTRAIHAAVKALEASILEEHLRGCVQEAMLSKSPKD